MSVLKTAHNQIIRPLLLEEIVQNNQKTGFCAGFFSIWSHLGTPIGIQKGTQRSASNQEVWPNV
jgi:hypothetical protein